MLTLQESQAIGYDAHATLSPPPVEAGVLAGLVVEAAGLVSLAAAGAGVPSPAGVEAAGLSAVDFDPRLSLR